MRDKTSFLEKYTREPELVLPKLEPLSVKVPEPTAFSISRDSDSRYVVDGPFIRYYLGHMRNQDEPEHSLIIKLETYRLTEKLLAAGIKEGDTVILNGKEYEFKD